jgi:pyruvate/2-oxoglutarate dehydrogenase complex dihydrolipoamide dehydrogenase (E3) component
MVLLGDDRHDEALRAEVAPPDWADPPARARYDLVVVGGGTAGLVSAAIAAGLGARVALVERELLGGDCLNYGCVPSKALLAAARRLGDARAAGALGVTGTADAGADFSAVMERMRTLRAGIAHHDSAARFRDLGVDVFLGEGRFTGSDALQVSLHGGDTRALRFKRAVLATGARPVVLPVEGLEETGFLTNHSLYALTERPERLVVVGAGPIGVEMAQAFARFGTQVTVVALDEQVLPREDPDAAAVVRASLERDGVRFELGARLQRVERRDDGKAVIWERDGKQGACVGDEILLAAGRRANLEGLGLDAAGIATTRVGVQVDDRLRTTNRRVHAAGDVTGLYQFTHAADAMARIVVRNAFFFGRGKASLLTMPWSTYTMPEVAHVGLYANEEERAGTPLDSLRMDFAGIDRSILEGETEGYAKVVFERRSGRLRGATVVHPHAGELLGEALIAVTRRLKVTELSSVIHPYPTAVSIWGRLGDLANRGRLTPRAARVLKALIRMRR